MNTKATVAVGSIGLIAFSLVGAGLWHIAGVLDMQAGARIAALAAASSTSSAERATTTPAVAIIPRFPRRSRSDASVGTATGPEEAVSASLEVTGAGSLNNLMSLGSNLTCTVSTVGMTPQRFGIAYLSGTRARVNLRTSAGSSTSLIDAGGYLYAWTPSETRGIKLIAASGASGSAIVTYGAIDPAQTLNYSCNLWKTNASLFAPPQSVAFTDTAGN